MGSYRLQEVGESANKYVHGAGTRVEESAPWSGHAGGSVMVTIGEDRKTGEEVVRWTTGRFKTFCHNEEEVVIRRGSMRKSIGSKSD